MDFPSESRVEIFSFVMEMKTIAAVADADDIAGAVYNGTSRRMRK